MCNRLSLSRPVPELEDFTKRKAREPELFTPYYHVSAFQHPYLPVITCEEPDVLQFAQWGYVPHYTRTLADATKYGSKMVNARIESLWELASFKQSAQYNRCLIIVDGFFEYYHIPWGGKVPYYITTISGEPMVMAGIYRRTKVEGRDIFSCAIVTSDAEGRLMGRIHNSANRTPYIIHPGLEGEWIAGLPQGPIVQEAAAEMHDEELKYWAVTRDLAKPGYDANQPLSLKPMHYVDILGLP